ncbi:hypothetical protein SDJN02_27985, partial [Cucurbita argyrosperma subsp. argyrosperma]
VDEHSLSGGVPRRASDGLSPSRLWCEQQHTNVLAIGNFRPAATRSTAPTLFCDRSPPSLTVEANN